MVKVDTTKTELILLNLLLSAVRRSAAGGHITIQAEQHDSEIVVSVIDNGESIPIKLLDRAFWQFYPVDDLNGKMPSTYQLGLYTTKHFVEMQNGRIWAESQADQGSKFSFSMPVWEEGQ
jgi:signal transduction histidine kinase